MAGALRIRGYADGGAATAQPAVYSNGILASSGNGALMLPGTPGNNPLASALPQLAGLPYLPMTPSPESQAFRQGEYGVAGSLLGLNPDDSDPTGVMGALSRKQSAEDTASAGKLASINQAIDKLQNLPGNNDAQMQNLAYRAGIMSNAGGATNMSWGAGDTALLKQIEAQREFERQNTTDIGGLQMSAAAIPEQQAKDDLADVWDRVTKAQSMGQSAMTADVRSQTAATNAAKPLYTLAGRLAASEITAAPNRYKLTGDVDPATGDTIYFDSTTGQHYAGPPVERTPSAPGRLTPNAAITAAQRDYDRFYPAPKVSPTDPTKDIYGNPMGPRAVPPEGMQTWIQKRAQGYQTGQIPTPGAQQPAPQPARQPAPQNRQAGPPPPPPSSPPAGFKQAPDGNYYAPDPQRPGKYLQYLPDERL